MKNTNRSVRTGDVVHAWSACAKLWDNTKRCFRVSCTKDECRIKRSGLTPGRNRTTSSTTSSVFYLHAPFGKKPLTTIEGARWVQKEFQALRCDGRSESARWTSERCSQTAPSDNTFLFASKRKSGRLFVDLSMTEKRAKRTCDHSARTFPGDRSVQEECAKRILTALTHLSFWSVFPFVFYLVFMKAAKKLVVEPPMTVDLSLIPLLSDFSLSHRDNPTSRHGVSKKRRHWEAQILSLFVVEESQTPDPSGLGEVRPEGRDLKGIGSDREESGAPFEQRSPEVKPLGSSEVEGCRKPDPRRTGDMGAKGQDIKERLEEAERSHVAPSEWRLTVPRWESEKHDSWCIAIEGYHVATGGSLLGVASRWSACGWSVVQLDHDEEMGADARDVRNAGCRTWGAACHQKSWANGFLATFRIAGLPLQTRKATITLVTFDLFEWQELLKNKNKIKKIRKFKKGKMRRNARKKKNEKMKKKKKNRKWTN